MDDDWYSLEKMAFKFIIYDSFKYLSINGGSKMRSS